MTSLCLNGDCLKLMQDISNNSIDLFMCDLPYGCLTTAKETSKKRFMNGVDTGTNLIIYEGGCPWDTKIDLVAFWIQVKRLAKNDKTPVLMFCDFKFGMDLITSNPKWFRYDLVWSKNRGVSFLLANKLPMKSHEMILVFSKKGANYNRVDEVVEGKEGYIYNKTISSKTYNMKKSDKIASSQEGGIRCVLSVINISNSQDKRHPTCKPLDLYEWLIKRYSNEGDTVLDPTAGSFNSGRACLELKRNYIGIEMDPVFYEKNKL